MCKVVFVIFAILSLSITGCSSTQKSDLVRIDSKDYGYIKFIAKVVELERDRNTSKIKTVIENGCGGSVGSSMFIMMGIYEVAKARNYEYFTKLKEWGDKDGGYIYIVGFTNTKDADIKKEFGEQYSYEDESGQKRTYMSVSQLRELMEKIFKVKQQGRSEASLRE